MLDMRRIRDLLYIKYRSFNERYFDTKLPHIPILIRNGVFLNGNEQECWSKYEFNGSYNKITRRIIEIKDVGEIYINTRHHRTDKEYIETLTQCMIYAYIYLVLKRYPRNLYGNILFYGNVYEHFATLINRQEGLDIEIPMNAL